MHAILDPSSEFTPSSVITMTTLYDLMDAMQDEVSPVEEELVVASVVHLLRSGVITFLGSDDLLASEDAESERWPYS